MSWLYSSLKFWLVHSSFLCAVSSFSALLKMLFRAAPWYSTQNLALCPVLHFFWCGCCLVLANQARSLRRLESTKSFLMGFLKPYSIWSWGTDSLDPSFWIICLGSSALFLPCYHAVYPCLGMMCRKCKYVTLLWRMAVHLVRTGAFPSVYSLCPFDFLSESPKNPLVAQLRVN